MSIKKLFFFTLILTSSFLACSAKKPIKSSKSESAKILFDAVNKQDLNLIKQQIKLNSNLNVYDSDGYTPLMRLVRYKNANLVELLVNSGAKIYQPHKNHKYITALSINSKEETEITRIFSMESHRLGQILETAIEEGSYTKALKISKENFLPVELVMPKYHTTSLEVIEKVYYIKQSIEYRDSVILYIQHLLSTVSPYSNYLFENINNLYAVYKVIGGQDLIEDIENTFLKSQSSMTKRANVSEDDIKDLGWLALKVRVLDELGSGVPLSQKEINIYARSMKSKILKQPKHWKKLVKTILESNNPSDKKILFIESTLEALLSEVQKEPRYLVVTKEFLQMVNLVGEGYLTSTKSSFDDSSLLILQALGPDYNFIMVKELIKFLFAFSPKNENKSDKSIKFIIDSDWNNIQKTNLLNFISTMTGHALPKGIFSYAIEKNGINAIRVLVNSKVRFHVNEQEDALVYAISHSASGEDANFMVIYLNNLGILPKNEFGVQALKLAFQKVWSGNKSYEDVITSLLLPRPSLLDEMSDNEVMDLLRNQLQEIKNKMTGIQLMLELLRSINRKLPSAYSISHELGSSGVIKISFVLDYILTAYQVYRFNPSNIHLISHSIGQAVSVFPMENFIMDVEASKFMFHHILPLSLILSIDPSSEMIPPSLYSTDVEPYRHHIDREPPSFSWKAFLSSDFYRTYSLHPKFWKAVSSNLIASDQQLRLPNDRTSIDFIKIMVSSGQIQRYSGLSELLNEENISLPENQKTCILMKSPQDKTNLPIMSYTQVYADDGVAKDRIERFSINHRTIKFPPYWSNLGTFEALRPLKNKTCASKSLSEVETSYLGSFIESNMQLLNEQGYLQDGLSKTYGYVAKKELCKAPQETYYYSPIGVLSSDATPSKHLFASVSGECDVYTPNKWAQSLVKKDFLSSWYSCAVNTEDQNLINIFNPLEKSGLIQPKDPDTKRWVYTCEWSLL